MENEQVFVSPPTVEPVAIQKRRPKWVYGLIVVLVVVLGYFVAIFISNLNKVTVEIVSVEGAELSIAGGKVTDFKGAGKTQASIKATKNSLFCVRAQLNEQLSQNCIQVPEEDTTLNITDFVTLKETETVLPGSLSHIFVDNDEILGVSPSSNSMVNLGINSNASFRLDFITLPYISGVSWYSGETYLYSSFSDSPGIVRSGVATSVDKSLNGDVLAISPAVGQSSAALTSTGVYITTNSGKSFKRVLSDTFDDFSAIGFDGVNTVVVDYQEAGEYATETHEGVDTGYVYEGGLAEISVINKDSTVLTQEVENVGLVQGLVYDSGQVYVLDNDAVVILDINTGEVTRSHYKLLEVGDIISHQNTIYAAGTSGIWQLFPETGALALVANTGEEVYVDNSLTIDSAGTAYFSTSTNTFGSSGNIYKVKL